MLSLRRFRSEAIFSDANLLNLLSKFKTNMVYCFNTPFFAYLLSFYFASWAAGGVRPTCLLLVSCVTVGHRSPLRAQASESPSRRSWVRHVSGILEPVKFIQNDNCRSPQRSDQPDAAFFAARSNFTCTPWATTPQQLASLHCTSLLRRPTLPRRLAPKAQPHPLLRTRSKALRRVHRPRRLLRPQEARVRARAGRR